MQATPNTNGLTANRDTLLVLLIALLAGVIVGLLLAPRSSNRTHTRAPQNDTHNRKDHRHHYDNHFDRSRQEKRNRSGWNIVFGNIIIGSNNAPDAVMTLGYDDSGESG